jgi:peroxiredoxin
LAGGLLVGSGLGVLILFGILGLGNGQNGQNPSSAPEIGALAPDFELQALSGERVRLTDWRGHPVLINFWATWCPPCIAEMPIIQARYALWAPDLVVLAINAGEPVADIRPFVAEQPLTFTILADPDLKVNDRYRVRGLPASFFVDSEGVIRAVHLGSLSETALDRSLEAIGLRK